eukprot:9234393-Pyramimonas_sp.AAC.1
MAGQLPRKMQDPVIFWLEKLNVIGGPVPLHVSSYLFLKGLWSHSARVAHDQQIDYLTQAICTDKLRLEIYGCISICNDIIEETLKNWR